MKCKCGKKEGNNLITYVEGAEAEYAKFVCTNCETPYYLKDVTQEVVKSAEIDEIAGYLPSYDRGGLIHQRYTS